MNPVLKLSALTFSGVLLGAIVWLWAQFGTEVFKTYAVSFASWCF